MPAINLRKLRVYCLGQRYVRRPDDPLPRAVYVLYGNWDEVSRRSRLELLRDRDAHFDRVVHTDGWEDRLTALLHDKLHERGMRRRRSGYRYRRRGQNAPGRIRD
jgi:hypothetical protein